jgi:opacity protein-like surface antigen
MFALSIGAAMGSGPALVEADGAVQGFAVPILALDSQDWWGVSALAAFNFNDAWHAEIGAGYKSRDYDGDSGYGYFGPDAAFVSSGGADYDTWAILGGIYYDPVPQLTLGLEAEYYTTETDWNILVEEVSNVPPPAADFSGDAVEYNLNNEVDNFSIDFVAVWRF